MSSIGMCALLYSVTVSPGTINADTTLNNMSKKPKNQRLARSTSASPGLYSYMTSSGDALKKYLFGINAKTKRSLAEEAECGDENCVNSWVREGVDPNEVDAYGYTPLLNASALGRIKVVKELIKHNADVNKTGPFGFTPLHAAAQGGYRELVSVLLRNGADLNAQNDDMDTPMHLALCTLRLEIVHLLLRNGGSAEIKGFGNKTCIDIAHEMGLHDLAETLKNFNAYGTFHYSFSTPVFRSRSRPREQL